MEERKKQTVPARAGDILRWGRLVPELAALAALYAPAFCTIARPEKELFSAAFLFWACGACFAASLLAVFASGVLKKAFVPDGQLSQRSLLRSMAGETGLTDLATGLLGAAFADLAAIAGVAFLRWTFAGLGLVMLYLCVSTGIGDRKKADRLRRGEYEIQLTELTDREKVTDGRSDHGSDGGGRGLSHKYYLSFGKARGVKNHTLKAGGRDYLGSCLGEAYYLLIVDGVIERYFPKSGYGLDGELQKRMVKDAGEE